MILYCTELMNGQTDIKYLFLQILHLLSKVGNRVVRVSVEMKLLLVISLMLGYSICHEDINQTYTEPRTPLQRIWIANSIVGVFGIILNGYVLLTFFQDRHKLVTSVNAMIM